VVVVAAVGSMGGVPSIISPRGCGRFSWDGAVIIRRHEPHFLAREETALLSLSLL
jgi:hypothetical protein